ncbi:hypothetical protein BJ684DRAFT_19440 [Piptocephalis cylindrospora]|uniref:Myb-like domain-containing protein n=1 Tax=Piptocephalis cylindrospora TaxID=1907219 RepID=A0A4P9Y5N3_9FUNG|nr:hypothetical protein BJ684DRAFT_19440 [Piptocephalis cylindrospora]|eukprot:RKP14134.1 hypothetical protein BJ684DRAFT_19440 [Piptocephalis cylindrospora]
MPKDLSLLPEAVLDVPSSKSNADASKSFMGATSHVPDKVTGTGSSKIPSQGDTAQATFNTLASQPDGVTEVDNTITIAEQPWVYGTRKCPFAAAPSYRGIPSMVQQWSWLVLRRIRRYDQRWRDPPYCWTREYFGVYWSRQDRDRLVEAIARHGRRNLQAISVRVPGKTPWQCASYISFLDRAYQVAKLSNNKLLRSFRRDYPLRRAPMARVTEESRVEEDDRWTGIIARMEDQVMVKMSHTSRPATMEEEKALDVFHLRHMTEISSLIWMRQDNSFGIQRDTVLLMHEALKSWLEKLLRRVVLFDEEARRVGDEPITITDTINIRTVQSAIEDARLPSTRNSWFDRLIEQLRKEKRLEEEEDESVEGEEIVSVSQGKEDEELREPSELRKDGVNTTEEGQNHGSKSEMASHEKRLYLPEHILNEIGNIDPFALESMRGRGGYGSSRDKGGEREEREYTQAMEEERMIEIRQRVLDQLDVAGILDYM